MLLENQDKKWYETDNKCILKLNSNSILEKWKEINAKIKKKNIQKTNPQKKNQKYLQKDIRQYTIPEGSQQRPVKDPERSRS